MRSLTILAIFLLLLLAISGCAKEGAEKKFVNEAGVMNVQETKKETQPETKNIDLAITNLTMSSADWAATYRVTISPLIRNLGDAVNNVEVGLYANEKHLKTFTLDFKKGETKSPQYDWYPEEPGKYEIKIIIDPAYKINDSNRMNNIFSYSIRIS